MAITIGGETGPIGWECIIEVYFVRDCDGKEEDVTMTVSYRLPPGRLPDRDTMGNDAADAARQRMVIIDVYTEERGCTYHGPFTWRIVGCVAM